MDNKVAWRVSLIDKLLEGEISKSSLSSECAVLLSGGVDSISVAFAAQRLGKTIHAYSFCLDKNESYDYKKAKEIAEIFGWKFTGVKVPISISICVSKDKRNRGIVRLGRRWVLWN